jgi:hypothetical protein
MKTLYILGALQFLCCIGTAVDMAKAPSGTFVLARYSGSGGGYAANHAWHRASPR